MSTASNLRLADCFVGPDAAGENADFGFGQRDLIALCGILRVDVVSNNRDGHIAIFVDLHILDLQRR
ncbi:hypothetical protein RFN25_29560 [Mesorhizobium abyssinicae]|uniref:Uncharacterized protein n=1 Tax=Mesorhizobium abyssinicae TaxID=1209958 RepID=A0ABU5AFD9_9HYPH|nr:hypothetical protein [Mesorhizobium abyssinicae]MDX8437558.1 hypothetical protein [Mesorhizobium abyssinicae]MDX8536004.1 hypothetical protein [Mesorhizobium abyssinicae]